MHGEDKERSQKMVRDRYRGLSEEEKKTRQESMQEVDIIMCPKQRNKKRT